MLFSSKYISLEVETFHNTLDYFFRQLGLNTHVVFSDNLFPAEVRPNLYKYRNPAKGYKKFVEVFEKIFELYNSENFDTFQKAKLISDFIISNEIDDICDDIARNPVHNDDLEVAVKNITPLFNQFYDKYFSDLVDRGAHLDLFITENGKICCICGLETISQYDHFIPKGVISPIYPFSCVNPRNLLPICQACNGPKSARLIIYEDEDRVKQRVVTFAPYSNFETWKHIQFKLINIVKPAVRDSGDWKVSFTFKDDALENDKKLKIKNWGSFFKIENRYSNEIKRSVKIWIEEFKSKEISLDEMIILTTPTESSIRRTNSIILQWLLYKYLNDNVELKTSLVLNNSTAQNPNDLLMEQGFED